MRRTLEVLRRAHTDEGGQAVVIVALLFVVLLGFAGLAIDGGRFYAERRFLQNAADAGALGCANKLMAGGNVLDAEAVGKEILRDYNLRNDPTGTGVVVSDLPQYTTWFNVQGELDKRNLSDGVVAGTNNCRVALLASMQTLFMRVLGFETLEIPAYAHAAAKGGMLPIVVNRYKDPPGPSSTFLDYSKQEAYQLANPNTCDEDGEPSCPNAATSDIECTVACLWGPETVIVGSGYDSSDSDFRGFVALDIRDFSSASHLYYNGVDAGTNANALKQQEGSYVNGGYPGPDLEPYVPGSNPVQPRLQIATMAGNSSGVVVSNFQKYVRLGDKILVQLFDGQVREIPEFTINAPSAISATADGISRTGPTFRVGANQRFRDLGDTVVLEMVRDTFNVSGNDTPGQLQDFRLSPGSEPSPPYAGRFVPAGGSGTQVSVTDLQVNSPLDPGIYSVIIKGTGYQPDGTQLSTKQMWVPLNVGGVVRDFSMDFDATAVDVPLGPGETATFSLKLKTGSSSQAWGSSAVTFAVDSGSCAVGAVALVPVVAGPPVVCGSVTILPSSAVPSKSSPPTVNVSIPTGSVAQGVYTLVLRARGTNSVGQPVVHVQPLTLGVGTTTGGTTKYVNVQGYSVFLVTSVDSNAVLGRAISGYYADPNDPALNVGRRAGLLPWEVAPY